jgi:hypothetical protein
LLLQRVGRFLDGAATGLGDDDVRLPPVARGFLAHDHALADQLVHERCHRGLRDAHPVRDRRGRALALFGDDLQNPELNRGQTGGLRQFATEKLGRAEDSAQGD